MIHNANDFVMVRVPKINTTDYFNSWFRIISIDNERNSFIGKCEKIDKYNFCPYTIGDEMLLNISDIQNTFKEGDQFCYMDDITICNCPGLCRNK